MEVGIEAARWVVGKALGPAAGGVLEAWAASSELGTNIRDLRMELLYAQGMLNNARGGGGGREDTHHNPALQELMQELRDLAYSADDALDEVDYFRIQDELDGTYHAADEHAGGGGRGLPPQPRPQCAPCRQRNWQDAWAVLVLTLC